MESSGDDGGDGCLDNVAVLSATELCTQTINLNYERFTIIFETTHIRIRQQ